MSIIAQRSSAKVASLGGPGSLCCFAIYTVPRGRPKQEAGAPPKGQRIAALITIRLRTAGFIEGAPAATLMGCAWKSGRRNAMPGDEMILSISHSFQLT